jgi:hypothetical protein
MVQDGFRHAASVAKVAVARKLAVRWYWMLRTGADYARFVRTQSSPESSGVDASPSRFWLGALPPRPDGESGQRIMVAMRSGQRITQRLSRIDS